MTMTPEAKADRLDFAFRTERDRLRHEGGMANLRVANELNTVVQGWSLEEKVRMFDLINIHETPEEALASMQR